MPGFQMQRAVWDGWMDSAKQALPALSCAEAQLYLTPCMFAALVSDVEEMVGLDVAKHGENATAVGAAVAEMNFGARDGLTILQSECKGQLGR